MKSVTVIGAGMGPDTMTAEGIKALDAAEFVFGAQRLLDGLLKGRNVQKAAYYTAEEINPAICKSSKERFAVLVSGDTLFCGAHGRTDFVGGDPAAMMTSLARLGKLPGNTVVLPGHNDITTIERESWLPQ